MLAELIGVLKKMRTTAGGVLIVEPSTGSEPITKACASATGGRDRTGDQLIVSSRLRISPDISRRLRKRPFRIQSSYIYCCESKGRPQGSPLHPTPLPPLQRCGEVSLAVFLK